ncbi:hypothetical protein CGGC5_v016495 [Colletotrichum fructicola Nara gc5]|uniref:Glycoside hydrolase family 43 n=1 Tax=Colletotrichum fructicola (strain Nara gc5) TaxID=1213859 RepID=A0A7J6IHN1_COLFN|nr:hypothetical protein CGGC5_v016495 [Colletotrichum fructicola Nara gc5]
MWLFSALSWALFLGLSVWADSDSNNGKGQNPEFYNSARHAAADPYVLYDWESGQYYAYSTEGADDGYHFAIYVSPDLSTWRKHPGGVLKACYDDQMKQIDGGQACWARDWQWAPETYYNAKTGWYFFFFAGRLREDMAKDHFRYSKFEEPSKLGVAVSRSPTGPFKEIQSEPIGYYPFDPDYHDVNLIMDDKQMLPPKTQEEGKQAPKGTYIPTIDPNIFFDKDGRIYLYTSRNAYRNWNWDEKLGKYIEESNIIVVEMDRAWWDDPFARTMPDIASSEVDVHARDAPDLPSNITSYNGTGEIGNPPRKDGWKTVISYGADPQQWENFHVDDYEKNNGTKKDRRWSEGSTVIRRTGKDGKPTYLLTYSANNYEASNYGVGFATAETPLGPFRKSAKNPVLSQAPDAEIPIYSTGHGSIVASPPKNTRSRVGAQEVTQTTPEGAELFYVHHARNDTTRDRSIYTTRMSLDDSSIYFGSDNAITMNLTSLDQPLPVNTYPIQLEIGCPRGRNFDSQFEVRVISKTGAPFDLTEGSNRVVAQPETIEASSIEPVRGRDGTFVLKFDKGSVQELAYQRSSVKGNWTLVDSQKLANWESNTICLGDHGRMCFWSSIKSIDKTYAQFLKKYKPNGSWTADEFSAGFARFLPMAQNLKDESLPLAFNLILDIGEHSYGDVDYGAKTCGYGDTDEPFQAMDNALLEIIESRLKDCTGNDCNDVAFILSPTTDDMGTSQDELREALKPKGIRNKSQFLMNDRARRGDQQLLMTRRRTRRMDTVDWAGNALNDLSETRRRIDSWGLGEHYFAKSIAKLSAIKGIDVPRYNDYHQPLGI